VAVLGDRSDFKRDLAPSILALTPALRASPASGAEEHEPDNAEDQYRKPGRDYQEGEYRGARLGLAGFGGGFDDPALLSCSHGVLDCFLVL
jgi:hypothetical protein